MARLKTVKNEQALEVITERQQTFIEALLSGKSITDAALITGISRRAATYWLSNPEHIVNEEYEKQRALQLQNFRARIAGIHEATLKAIEDALSEASPPAIRFQAAKLIYEKHLERYGNVRMPSSALDLAKAETRQVEDRASFQRFDEKYLPYVPE
ncbi:MAG TPA: hypothetical protein VGN34_12100 [Ktedonobacteraceae bacterium]|jgi:hypothetical protein